MNRRSCILTASALALVTANLSICAATTDGGFSVTKAAEFLDLNAHAFEKDCFACHATFAYLMARPAIPLPSATLAETRRALEQFIEKQADDKETSPRRVTETVMAAAALALQDASTTRKLHPQTRKALERMWDLQRADGGWDWSKADEPPSAIDEHFGATMAAFATGMAPEDYANSARARQGIASTRRYLREHPPSTLHQRLMWMLAAARLGEFMDDGQREQSAGELFALQCKDGGWAMASLADWKRLDGTPQQLAEGDGYGTGFALYVLRSGRGIPGTDPRLQRAVNWLKTHQRENGSWFTRSPRGRDDLSTYTGTVFAVLGLSACGELNVPGK